MSLVLLGQNQYSPSITDNTLLIIAASTRPVIGLTEIFRQTVPSVSTLVFPTAVKDSCVQSMRGRFLTVALDTRVILDPVSGKAS